MKQEEMLPIAEKMYIGELMSFAAIAQQLKINEKTARRWARDGRWAEKRKECIASHGSFHSELYEFARVLMKSIRLGLESGIDVSAQMNAMCRLLDKLPKTKEYEDKVKSAPVEEQEKDPKITGQEIARRVEEVLC
jgi:hypothetical protein